MVYLFLSKSFGTQLAPLGVLNALIHRNTRTHTQKNLPGVRTKKQNPPSI